MASVDFIQIGAHVGKPAVSAGPYTDPVWRGVVQHGWRGVLCEPLPHLHRALLKNYEQARCATGNVFTQAAIVPAGYPASVVMHHLDPGVSPSVPWWVGSLGSVRRDVIERHRPARGNITTTIVPALKLRELCRDLKITRVQRLFIDAEGLDADLILDAPIKTLGPWLVQYEHKHSDESKLKQARKKLVAAGYCLGTVDELNETWVHPSM